PVGRPVVDHDELEHRLAGRAAMILGAEVGHEARQHLHLVPCRDHHRERRLWPVRIDGGCARGGRRTPAPGRPPAGLHGGLRPARAATGTTAPAAPARAYARRRMTIDAIPVPRMIAATPSITGVVPTRSAIRPMTITGTKLATDTRVNRTPYTRPRTSSGSSSCSCVWDEIATSAYAIPARNATATTTDSTETTVESESDVRASRPARIRGIDPTTDNRAMRTPSATRPVSMSRCRS